jgi:hypothetical protein
MNYVCTLCGQIHEGLPDVAFERPAYNIPEDEREKRVHLSADFCVVDDEDYFIRGIIEIPIHGQDENFGIGAWVSQKQENYETYKEHFDTSEIGPFFGWLSNDFIFEGARTLHLKTMVHFQGQGLRPRIELEPTEHPLALAQRDGISLEQAWLFVHRVNGDLAP